MGLIRVRLLYHTKLFNSNIWKIRYKRSRSCSAGCGSCERFHTDIWVIFLMWKFDWGSFDEWQTIYLKYTIVMLERQYCLREDSHKSILGFDFFCFSFTLKGGEGCLTMLKWIKDPSLCLKLVKTFEAPLQASANHILFIVIYIHRERHWLADNTVWHQNVEEGDHWGK